MSEPHEVSLSLPSLFAYDKKGRSKAWTISYGDGFIKIAHGLFGGKLAVKRTPVKGKNIGKANETSPLAQAIKEADSRWTKQVEREDYAQQVEDSGKQLRPMLAKDYVKTPKQLDWSIENWFCQPKLDGARLIHGRLRPLDVKRQFISRKGITYALPHLEDGTRVLLNYVRSKADEFNVDEPVIALDGEVYYHGWDLGRIMSAVRSPKPDTWTLEYHVFDIIMPGVEYATRRAILEEAHYEMNQEAYRDDMADEYDQIKLVQAHQLNKEEMEEWHGTYTQHGYEGIMLRDGFSMYEPGRSLGLFKRKHFLDEECKIVDVFADRWGNAMLKVQRTNGVELDVTPKRTHEERKSMLRMHPDVLVGQWLTVKYQAETPDGSLQFPVGLAIRPADEDGNALL